MKDQLFRLNGGVRRDPAVEAWFERRDELRWMVKPWFDLMRGCGDDVVELMHDGCPTACVGDGAFAYVNAFKAHVAVGFFTGFALKDPAKLLEGTGKRMRHVKLKPGVAVDEAALKRLIAAAYADVRKRI